jgi:hypothetical protein
MLVAAFGVRIDAGVARGIVFYNSETRATILQTTI